MERVSRCANTAGSGTFGIRGPSTFSVVLGCVPQPFRVLSEHRGHHLKPSAHDQGQQASFADSATSAIDTTTCSGTASSPDWNGGPQGPADWQCHDWTNLRQE